MPRYAADLVLLAPLDDVWAFLAEPYHLGDWWPGIAGVQPDRRGLAPGARWRIQSTSVLNDPPLLIGPGLFRRPGSSGMLLVTDVVPERLIAFQLVDERISAELELTSVDERTTRVALVVDAPWLAIRRSYPTRALRRLYDLVQTAAEL